MAKEPSPILDIRSEPETLQFLLQVTEVANSSLDLDELLGRIAEVIRQAVEYEILAILPTGREHPGAVHPLWGRTQ